MSEEEEVKEAMAYAPGLPENRPEEAYAPSSRRLCHSMRFSRNWQSPFIHGQDCKIDVGTNLNILIIGQVKFKSICSWAI